MADLRYALTTGSPGGYDGTYTTVQAWWDAECRDYDFVTNQNTKTLEGFDDWPTGLDSSNTTINQGGTYSANATYHPKITSASGNRHNGTFNSGFRLRANGWVTEMFTISAAYVELDGFEIVTTGGGIPLLWNSSGAITRVSGLLIHGEIYDGIVGVPDNSTVDSCFIIGTSYTRRRGIHNYFNANNVTVNNVTVIDFQECFRKEGAVAVGMNCNNCAGTLLSGGPVFHASLAGDNNAASDGSAPGANSIQDLVKGDFKDSASNDYHIETSSRLYRAGSNQYDGSGAQADIDGELWPAAGDWDIGGDYNPGGVTPPTATQNAIFMGHDW